MINGEMVVDLPGLQRNWGRTRSAWQQIWDFDGSSEDSEFEMGV